MAKTLTMFTVATGEVRPSPTYCTVLYCLETTDMDGIDWKCNPEDQELRHHKVPVDQSRNGWQEGDFYLIRLIRARHGRADWRVYLMEFFI